MEKKNDFIKRILLIIKKDLENKLPSENNIGDYEDEFEDYLKEKFL